MDVVHHTAHHVFQRTGVEAHRYIIAQQIKHELEEVGALAIVEIHLQQLRII